MDLIVDANILFAALIKEGATAKLLYLDELHLYAPEFLLDEFSKYRDLIMKKTSRSSDVFEFGRTIGRHAPPVRAGCTTMRWLRIV